MSTYAVSMVRPDAMSAAAAHVSREYGYTGYVLGVEMAGLTRAVFLVQHFDGSEFRLMADQYGNVDRLPDEWPTLGGADKRDVIDALDEARSRRLSEVSR